MLLVDEHVAIVAYGYVALTSGCLVLQITDMLEQLCVAQGVAGCFSSFLI